MAAGPASHPGSSTGGQNRVATLRPLPVTPLGLTIYGLAITFMGRQKQKNRWIPGAGIELTAIAMSIPVSYQLRYQIDFEISAG